MNHKVDNIPYRMNAPDNKSFKKESSIEKYITTAPSKMVAAYGILWISRFVIPGLVVIYLSSFSGFCTVKCSDFTERLSSFPELLEVR